MTKISIIIPVYNSAPYIKDCLCSLITQSLKDIEIICVDDSSTDNSLSILKQYSSKHSNLKIIQQKNSGAGIARNKGIDIAKGEYIYFLDSDDYLANNEVLEVLYNEITKKKLDILIFNYLKYYEKFNFKVQSKINLDTNKNLASITDKNKILLTSKIGIPWNKLYKKTFLMENKTKFAPDLFYEDTLFFFEAIILANSIEFKDYYSTVYRKRNNSMMKNNNKNKDIIKIYDQVYTFLLRENLVEDFILAFSKKSISGILGHFKKTSLSNKKEYFIQSRDFINKLKGDNFNFDLALKNNKKLLSFVKTDNFYVSLLKFGLF